MQNRVVGLKCGDMKLHAINSTLISQKNEVRYSQAKKTKFSKLSLIMYCRTVQKKGELRILSKKHEI